MNAALWIAQGVLAATFAASGVVKGTQSKAKLLATGQTGVKHYSITFIRFIATCEVLGAIGLGIPWLTGIAPGLTPLAAVCLGLIMIGAGVSHSQLAREERRPRELINVGVNVLLLSACLFVALGRFRML